MICIYNMICFKTILVATQRVVRTELLNVMLQKGWVIPEWGKLPRALFLMMTTMVMMMTMMTKTCVMLHLSSSFFSFFQKANFTTVRWPYFKTYPHISEEYTTILKNKKNISEAFISYRMLKSTRTDYHYIEMQTKQLHNFGLTWEWN